jgi:4-azaleucine resistance transporter AzlC
VRGELPILLGVFPFGMIYGILALQAGLSVTEAQTMSAIVFAGSSQFIFTQMVESGAPGLILVITVAVVNLRHALYSASTAPYLQKLSPVWKWCLSYLLTDEAYAVSIVHYMKESASPYKHYYFLWAGLTLWAGWQTSTAAGIFLGAQIPAHWPLDFTLALTFIALVIPALKDQAAVMAALAAGLTAVLAFSLPYKLGLVAAALVGILCGLGWEAGQDWLRSNQLKTNQPDLPQDDSDSEPQSAQTRDKERTWASGWSCLEQDWLLLQPGSPLLP